MKYTEEEIKSAFEEFLNKYDVIPYGVLRPVDFFKAQKAFTEGHEVFGVNEIYFEIKEQK